MDSRTALPEPDLFSFAIVNFFTAHGPVVILHFGIAVLILFLFLKATGNPPNGAGRIFLLAALCALSGLLARVLILPVQSLIPLPPFALPLLPEIALQAICLRTGAKGKGGQGGERPGWPKSIMIAALISLLVLVVEFSVLILLLTA